MARLKILAAALAAALIAAPCGAAEEVEIVAESAPVKVRDATVATVRRGERYRVVQRKGPWTAIAIGEGAERKEGWVLSDKLRPIVDPALDDESPAPDAPSSVYASAELVQMTSHGPAPYLILRLSLTNASDRAMELTVADLVLHVGDRRLPYTRPQTKPFPSMVALFPGEYPRARADTLLWRLNYVEALLALKDADAGAAAAALLASATKLSEKQQVLQSFGRHGGEQVIAAIEPMLDDAEACLFAAQALAMLRTPKVVPVLEKRLLSADYQYGPKLLLGLAREPRWLDDNFPLLKQASGSPNAATQAAAKKLRAGEAIEIEQ